MYIHARRATTQRGEDFVVTQKGTAWQYLHQQPFFFPLRAVASLPLTATRVAELVPAGASHVVAAMGQLHKAAAVFASRKTLCFAQLQQLQIFWSTLGLRNRLETCATHSLVLCETLRTQLCITMRAAKLRFFIDLPSRFHQIDVDKLRASVISTENRGSAAQHYSGQKRWKLFLIDHRTSAFSALLHFHAI